MTPAALLLALCVPAAALPDPALDAARRVADRQTAAASSGDPSTARHLGREGYEPGPASYPVRLNTDGGRAAPLAPTRLPPENRRFANPPAGPVFAAAEGAAKAEAEKPPMSRQAAEGTAIGLLAGAAIGFMIGGPAGAIFGAVIGMMIGAWVRSENKPIFNFGRK